MATPEWPFATEHPDVGCKLYYEEALPLFEAGRFDSAIPLLARSLCILVRCSEAVGQTHPRQLAVERSYIEAMQKIGSTPHDAKAEAERVVSEARKSTRPAPNADAMPESN